jgi:hypothetical protein
MPIQTGAVPVRSYIDGPRITVDAFLKDPLRIQELVFQMTDQQFLVDALLRSAGPVSSGAVEFFSSTPLYADVDSGKRAEFAEVPVAVTSRGTPSVSYVAERALAVLISDEMRRRMNVDPVNVQLMQVKNTLVKNWEDAFISALIAGVTQTVTPSGAWSTATSGNIARVDITKAMKLVATAAAPGQSTAFGFVADTLVVGAGRQFDLIKQADFNAPYVGNMASENLLFTGKLPNRILGLDVVVSRMCPDSIAFVLQRKVAGFIADELPLQTSALYRDEPRKVWRADVQRASAIGLDQPLAIAMIGALSGGGMIA